MALVPGGYSIAMASPSMPPSWFDRRCHNPACAIEGVPLKRCGSCQVARYCTATCQAEDWRRHRGVECRGYAERRQHLRLVAPERSIMARQEPFEGGTMGVLSSCGPSEALVTHRMRHRNVYPSGALHGSLG